MLAHAALDLRTLVIAPAIGALLMGRTQQA